MTGNGAGDQLALRLQTGVPTTVELDVGNDGSANFSFDRALFERVAVNAPRATTPTTRSAGRTRSPYETRRPRTYRVTLGLEAVLGGGAGDAQVDNVIVNGTSSRDVIGIVARAARPWSMDRRAGADRSSGERQRLLTVNGLGGNDSSIGSACRR